MDHHRRCEACNHCHSATLPPTHPYLKRRSKSSTLTTRTAKIPEPVNANYVDIFTANITMCNVSTPDPLLTSEVDSSPDPTSDDSDLDKRVAATQLRLARSLEEARKALTAPCVAPTELTSEERADKVDALAWAGEYEKREQKIEEARQKTDGLFTKFVDAADRLDVARAGIAPISRESTGEARVKLETSLNQPLDEADGSQSDVSVTTSAPIQPEAVCEIFVAAARHQKRTEAVLGPKSTKPSTKTNAASGNTGWHTLWSFDCNASW